MRYLLLPLLFCLASLSYASEQISLKEFLNRANQDGFNIIFSSDLVLPHFTVDIDPQKNMTVARLTRALKGFDLQLKAIGKNTYTVTNLSAINIKHKDKPTVEIDSSFNIVLEELIVTSSHHRLLVKDGLSRNSLNQTDLNQRPAVGNDPIRLVNQFPGSASVGVSSRPNVRGGDEDETLISFDGMTLYEPFHFNSFNNLFGSFDNRIIDSIDFQSGGYSAKYGDRMSATMFITPRDNNELIGTKEIGIGLYNLSYLQAGGDAKQNWIINARRSTVELLTAKAENDLGKPSFADLFARYSLELNNQHQLSFNVFWFGDDIELRKASANEFVENIYGNTYLWAKSVYDWSDSLYVESIVGFSAIKNDRKGSIDQSDFVTGNLNDDREFRAYNLKQDYEYLHNSNLLIGFGWDYRYLIAQYKFSTSLTIDPFFSEVSNYSRPLLAARNLDETGHQYSLYTNVKWLITNRLSSEFGVRFDGQHYESTISAEQINPRLSLLYQVSKNAELRLSWGEYSQTEGIYELKISDGLNDFQKPQKISHLIIGWTQSISENMNIRIEAYKKAGSNINPYYQNLTNPLSLLPELQPDRFLVIPDRLKSKGIELALSGQFGDISYWSNYSYASTKDKIGNQEVKRNWDQNHSGNLGISTAIKQWQVSLSGSFHQGWPTSQLSIENGKVKSGKRNSARFNQYISWDIKIGRSWDIGNQSLRIESGVTNLTNRANQVGVDYEVEGNELSSSPKFGLPLAPFLDLYWKF